MNDLYRNLKYLQAETLRSRIIHSWSKSLPTAFLIILACLNQSIGSDSSIDQQKVPPSIRSEIDDDCFHHNPVPQLCGHVTLEKMRSYLQVLAPVVQAYEDRHELNHMIIMMLNCDFEPGALLEFFSRLKVQYLHLFHCNLSQSDFHALRLAHSVETLRMEMNFSDENLQFLEEMPKLRFLDLIDADMSGSCLNYVKVADNIEFLSLCRTRFGDQNLPLLTRFTRLLGLDISGTRCTAPEFLKLAPFPNLRFLYCNLKTDPDNWFHVYMIQPILSRPKAEKLRMRELNLSDCNFTDNGLGFLDKDVSIEQLDVSSTKVTDLGIPNLKHCKEVTALRINNTKVTDKGLEMLAELPHLTYFYCSNTEIHGDGFKEFAEHSLLKELDVSGNDLSEAGLRAICKLPKIERISFVNCKLPVNRSFFPSNRWTFMDLGNTNIHSVDIKKLSRSKNLQYLSLNGLTLTAIDFQALASLPNLRRLSLERVRGLGHAEVKVLAHYRKLLRLHLFESDISQTDAEFLQKKLPNCLIDLHEPTNLGPLQK